MGIWQRWPTVSIANGSNEFTGSLTLFSVDTRPGDGISFNGGSKWYEVAALDGATPNVKGTIVGAFAESSVVNGPCIIDNRSYRHQVPSDIIEQIRLVLKGQSDVFEVSGAPPADLGSYKSIAFDPGARVFYYKTEGGWGGAVSLGGADGDDAGFRAQFSTSTGMSDPGTGFVRFNNATHASVTAIAIHDLSADVGTPDISNYILTWDDSTSTVRGTLIFREVATPQNFAIFAITGASTDNAGWTRLAVTHVVSGGTFGNNDDLTATFIRAGDAGTAGINGVNSGLLFTLSTNTTMADPGAGTLRFNNATIASATQMAIDATSAAAGNPSVSALINTWDDSTNTAFLGTLRFMKRGAEENFAAFSVAGALTDNTGWLQVPLTYITGGGTLINGDTLVVQFDRTGDVGDDGVDGVSTAFEFTFSTTTAMADPGTGAVRLDNATFASVTSIAIDDTSAETSNPDVSAAILTWDQSTSLTNRGTLTLRKKSAKQNFAQYVISGASTDNSGWTQLAVTHVASAGSFSNAEILLVEFVRSGDKGVDGTGAVDSVNSQTGDVVLSASEIEAAHTPLNYLTAGASLNDHLQGVDDALATAGISYAATTIASASTVNIGGATTATVIITGTTTITSLGTVADTLRYVRFSAALTLTYNATTLILPGAANITTAANDQAVFLSDASGNWRCLSYQRASSLNYSQANILGTVSQAAGIPTGAILEGGNNADGYYIRFANGWQICTHILATGAATTASGNVFVGTAVTWTFPAAFSTTTGLSTMGNIAMSNSTSWANVTPGSGTAATIRRFSSISDATDRNARIVAIGLWF